MRILVIEPECKPRVRVIDGKLKTMQEIVGGLIQPIYAFSDSVALVCNDEGKLMNLPPNRCLRDDSGQVYDIVCGTFFICGIDGDSFASLTDEQIQRFKSMFAVPELFVNLSGHLMILPME